MRVRECVCKGSGGSGERAEGQRLGNSVLRLALRGAPRNERAELGAASSPPGSRRVVAADLRIPAAPRLASSCVASSSAGRGAPISTNSRGAATPRARTFRS